MSEENWALHGGIQACDLCHSRKVKCDRQDPCKNCMNANVQCMRTRQKKTSHPRVKTDDKIQALMEKLASLENAVRSTGAYSQSKDISSYVTPISNANSTGDNTSSRPSKRIRTEGTTTQDARSPSDSVTSQLHRNGGARDHIEKELSFNESLAAHQRTVFETAIAFIDQLSKAPSGNFENTEVATWDSNVSTEFYRKDLVELVLTCQQVDRDKNRLDLQLFQLDHIPPKALERMSLILLEDTADDRAIDMYKVIVHFKAALKLHASQLNAPKHPQIRNHVKDMQLHHLNAAHAALNAVSFMAPPSLLLLQALLTGSILMYMVGNSQSCWSLNAYASRTLVALGYHNISDHDLSNPKGDQEQEVHAAVAWCYHLDRVMSLLLLRPPSLPRLRVPVASLILYNPDNTMAIFARSMLELEPVHDKILELTLISQQRRMPKAEVEPQVDELRKRMDDMYQTIQQARTETDIADSPDYLLHWHSLEFKFFSTLTAVHRLSNTVCCCASERGKCLYAARRALQCVKTIQGLAKQQDHFLKEYSPYLSWTVLSYPISPFFVIFCNVVGTSDVRDFQLLQDVVDSVSSLVIENKYVERLRRLCNMLLSLCRPLVHSYLHPTSVIERQPAETSNMMNQDVTPTDLGFTNLEGTYAESHTLMKEPWQDDMMWQLLQAQPSLDWFNSELLDPASWDLNLPS